MPSDYAIMGSTAMLPFDSRPSASGPLQRPAMAPHCMMPGSYSSAPVNGLPSMQFHAPPAYQLAGYHSPPSTPQVVSPLKAECQDRRSTGSESDDSKEFAYWREQRQRYEEQIPSPARSESQASSIHSISTNPSLCSRTIIHNQAIHVQQVTFGTEVDQLMKAIQRKPAPEPSVAQQSPTSEVSDTSEGKVRRNGRRYLCNNPNCNKTFAQKTHLDIHRRIHTGDKPYQCRFEDCRLTFSQLGNLKTHERRHTGERPFKCGQCDRTFAQRGNVRAHEQTHEGLKPYVCILDNCNKTFSQLGNMKTHQNNFHKKTIKELTARFAFILKTGVEVAPVDRELFEYFSTHYKNSNKGIKGRGKARVVAERKPKPACAGLKSARETAPYTLPQVSTSVQVPRYQDQKPGLCHPGSLAAYSVSRVHHHMMNPTPRDYEMFDMDDEHSSVPSSNASTSGLLYE